MQSGSDERWQVSVAPARVDPEVEAHVAALVGMPLAEVARGLATGFLTDAVSDPTAAQRTVAALEAIGVQSRVERVAEEGSLVASLPMMATAMAGARTQAGPAVSSAAYGASQAARVAAPRVNSAGAVTPDGRTSVGQPLAPPPAFGAPASRAAPSAALDAPPVFGGTPPASTGSGQAADDAPSTYAAALHSAVADDNLRLGSLGGGDLSGFRPMPAAVPAGGAVATARVAQPSPSASAPELLAAGSAVGGGAPSDDLALELDLAGPGLEDIAPHTGPAAAEDAASPASPSSGSAIAATPSSSPVSGVAMASARLQASPSPSGTPRLFGDDIVAGALMALAVGLALAILPAWMGGREPLRRVDTLTAELEDAIERPLAVRAGQARAPSEITAEIDAALGGRRTKYLWTWLGVGLVLGAGLTFAPRPPQLERP